MIAPKALEAFLTGKLGTVFPKELVEHIEGMREETNADHADFTSEFNQGAQKGETIIKVTFTVEVYDPDDDLDEEE